MILQSVTNRAHLTASIATTPVVRPTPNGTEDSLTSTGHLETAMTSKPPTHRVSCSCRSQGRQLHYGTKKLRTPTFF